MLVGFDVCLVSDNRNVFRQMNAMQWQCTLVTVPLA